MSSIRFHGDASSTAASTRSLRRARASARRRDSLAAGASPRARLRRGAIAPGPVARGGGGGGWARAALDQIEHGARQLCPLAGRLALATARRRGHHLRHGRSTLECGPASGSSVPPTPPHASQRHCAARRRRGLRGRRGRACISARLSVAKSSSPPAPLSFSLRCSRIASTAVSWARPHCRAGGRASAPRLHFPHAHDPPSRVPRRDRNLFSRP